LLNSIPVDLEPNGNKLKAGALRGLVDFLRFCGQSMRATGIAFANRVSGRLTQAPSGGLKTHDDA
jgi:hypothetical protein